MSQSELSIRSGELKKLFIAQKAFCSIKTFCPFPRKKLTKIHDLSRINLIFMLK